MTGRFIHINYMKKLIDEKEIPIGSDTYGDGSRNYPFLTMAKAKSLMGYNKYTMEIKGTEE